MDFLNKSLQQIRDLLNSMTTGAKIMTALLAGVLVISLVYLFQYRSSTGEMYLLGGREFSQAELGAMEGALAEAGVTGYEIVGYRLKLPRGSYDEAVAALNRASALPMSASELDDPNQSFNPLLTRTQEEEKQKAFKKQKFATMMAGMDSLEYATLEFDEQIEGGLSRRRIRSALVTARAKDGRELSGQEIQMLVSAVEGVLVGIDPANITIVDGRTSRSHKGSAHDPRNDPANNPYAIAKASYEEQYRQKIYQRLLHYNPNVQVNVELDDTMSHIEQSQQLSNGVVVVSESEKETNQSNNPATGGRPGVVPNTGAANSSSSVASTGATNNSTQSRETTQTRPGATVTQTERAPLVPKQVAVSIGIPESYYRGLWAVRNPPVEGEEPKPMTPADLLNLETEVKRDVEAAVKALLPNAQQGQNVYEPIVVTTDRELPAPVMTPPAATDGILTWLNRNWQTLAMIGLGGFGLIMLRGMVRSAAPPAPAADSESDAAAKKVGEDGEELDEMGRPKRRFEAGSAPSLKDELSELIEDDPDAAVSVLKQWIGDAA